ncbi:MAG: glycoside hydrolase family 52 protein, partial [Planctomycetota bacterium]
MPAALPHSYQAEHGPRGAEGSFSMGLVGGGGGFTLESGKTGTQDVFLGYAQGRRITALPYCAAGGQALDTGMADFVPTGGGPTGSAFSEVEVRYLPADAITRDYRLATDTWHTDGLSFSLFTPVDGIPHPDTAPASTMKEAICPAIVGQYSIDNTQGNEPLTAFFGVAGLGNFCFLEDETGGEILGLHCLDGTGVATH